MRVLITGGTGTIGRRLVNHLIKHGHVVTVISRRGYRPANLPAKITFAPWDGKTAAGWVKHVETADAIINLAGAGIADTRWTDERKRLIECSRVEAGQAVVEAVKSADHKPRLVVQASAVGYYGVHNDDQFITEESGPGNDFLARVCKAWEASTEPIDAMGIRRVILRSGVLLDPQGGAFPKLVLPFRFFAGGPVGSGRQWVPWIHYLDEVDAICFLLEQETAAGPFNLAAPEPVRNRDLARTIGQAMKRPAFAPAPGFAFKAAFGEMATVLLDGQRVVPKRLQEIGYNFKFPQVGEAMVSLIDEYLGRA